MKDYIFSDANGTKVTYRVDAIGNGNNFCVMEIRGLYPLNNVMRRYLAYRDIDIGKYYDKRKFLEIANSGSLGLTVQDSDGDNIFILSATGASSFQAHSVSIINVADFSFTINWSGGSGSNTLVIVKENDDISIAPIDGNEYSANAIFGLGSLIGGGYVVYNGNGYSVNVTGLLSNTTYYVAIFTFSGNDYVTDLTANNKGNSITTQTTFVLRDYTRPSFRAVVGGNDWVGRTSMADLGSRQLLVYRESTGHSAESGQLNIVYSTNGFVTSTAANTLLPSDGGGASTFFPYSGGSAPTGTAAADFSLFKCPNGDVLLISHQTKVAVSPDDWITNWVHRSTDQGNTWSSDGDLGDKIAVADKRKFWAFFDYTVIGTDMYFVFGEYSSSKSVSRVRLVKSSDNGNTFSDVGMPFGDYISGSAAPNECAIQHVGGGHMVCITRTSGLILTYIAHSYDYGVTWSSKIEQSANQFNGAGVHQPRLHMFSGDHRLWLSGRSYYDANNTTNMIAYSVNGGDTWVRLELDPSLPGDSGYTDMIKRADGTYYAVGYTGDENASELTGYLLEFYSGGVYTAGYQSLIDKAITETVGIPGAASRSKQNALYKALLDAGIFAKTDYLAVGNGTGSQTFSLYNWANLATVVPNQPSGTKYVSGAGWQNGGTADLGHTNIAFNPSTGVNYQQNSCAWAVGHTGVTPPAAIFGAETSGNVNRVSMVAITGTTAQFGLQSAVATQTYQVHNAGRYYAERTSSTATELFFNNSSIMPRTATSAARPNLNLPVTAFRTSAAVYGNPVTVGYIQYIWFGAPLTTIERANFDAAFAAYLL